MRKKILCVHWQLLIVVVVVLVLLTSYVVGKYVKTEGINGNVTFTADLVDSIILRESKLILKEDGHYELAVNNYVDSGTQDYTLIPGLGVPKNPHIIINGKTSVAAYLFVEVASSVDPGTLTYAVDAYSSDNTGGVWKNLNITGKNGGEVFVYTGGGEEPLRLTDDPENPIYILKEDGNGNTITVSQHLLHESVEDEDDLLVFYASMGDAALCAPNNDIPDEIDVYKAIYSVS